MTALRRSERTPPLAASHTARAGRESSPVVVDDVVYVGAADGRLFALNVKTGKAALDLRPPGPHQLEPLRHRRPRLHHDLHRRRRLPRAGRTGTRIWLHYFQRDAFRYESFYASPSSDGRRIFTVARSGTVLAPLDAATGSTRLDDQSTGTSPTARRRSRPAACSWPTLGGDRAGVPARRRAALCGKQRLRSRARAHARRRATSSSSRRWKDGRTRRT